MQEEIKTCQGHTWDPSHHENLPCSHPLYDDKHCICHSEDPDKDIDKFNIEVRKQLDREDYHDFSEFDFPKDFSFRKAGFKRDVYFRRAMFSGEAKFNKTKFGGEADFYSSKFGGKANFESAKFGGIVYFQSAKFIGNANFVIAKFGGGVNFWDVRFGDEADFRGAKFVDKASFTNVRFGNKALFDSTVFGGEADFREATFGGEADFWEAMFGGDLDFGYAQFGGEAYFRDVQFGGETEFASANFIKAAGFSEIKLSEKTIVKFDGEINIKDEPVFQDTADFKSITISKDAAIIFRKIDLSKCEFLETDLTKVEFIDVTWAKTGGTYKWFKTNAVYDAIKNGKNGDYDYGLIAQLYRRLQINYIDNCYYSEAGDFHIGEQEMARRGKGKFRRIFSTNMFYKLISNYGESFVRPLLWLVFVLLLFPAIFLYSGIDLSSLNEPASKNPNIVRYKFSANPANCFLLTKNYKRAFYKNFSFISFNRSEINKCLVSEDMRFVANLEIIIVIVLLSFFVLALRRSYKRHI